MSQARLTSMQTGQVMLVISITMTTVSMTMWIFARKHPGGPDVTPGR